MTHRQHLPEPEGRAQAAGAGAGYLRHRDLPCLLPLWPHEVDPANLADHAQLLARIRRALRLERMRGIAGHWAYDLARHAALLRAYRAEVGEYLREARSARPGTAASAE